MFKSKIAENILAEHLINNGAVSFLTERPMRLKSGLITPDLRRQPPPDGRPGSLARHP